MYQIGLVSVSFRGLSPEEIIRIAKDAGLNRIEWGSDVHAPFDDAERLSTIAACQRSAGLRCSSYGTYFVLGRDDPAVLSGYIAAAKCLEPKAPQTIRRRSCRHSMETAAAPRLSRRRRGLHCAWNAITTP